MTAQLVKRFVMLFLLQVRQLVHHDHAQKRARVTYCRFACAGRQAESKSRDPRRYRVSQRAGTVFAHIPAFSAVAVDTTGAGDAFNGALAAALAKGESLVKAAWYASAFASLAVEKEGAANMPDISLVDARIQQQNVAIQTF